MKKLVPACTALALIATGCSKQKEEPPAAEPKAATPTPVEPTAPSPPPAPPAPPGIQIDPEIHELVKAIVSGCTVDEQAGSVWDCKNGEDYAVINYAAPKRLTSTFESLAEIALTDGAKDPKVLTAVIATWNSFGDRELQKLNSTPAAAERVLKLFEKVSPDADRFAYAAPIALAAGKKDALTAILKKLPATSRLKQASVQQYLSWGGVAALPDVQAFFQSGANDEEKAAAVWSVGVALYDPAVAEGDKAQMCDWAKTIAADPAITTRVLASASGSLARCKGAYIDAALSAVEARIAAEKLSDRASDSLHHLCWAEGIVGGAVNGTKEQCERGFAILARALTDKDAPPGALRQGVWVAEMLGKNGEGLDKQAKALISKFKSHKDAAVADQAKRSLESLK
jgi:hypothetical protein